MRPEVSLSGPHRPVTEGDNVTLICNITDGVPNPDNAFQTKLWYYDLAIFGVGYEINW